MNQKTGNSERVRAFVDAWNRSDHTALCAAFADDAVYHNVPLEPINGKSAISVAIAQFLEAMTAIQWRMVHIAESADGTVLTERVDAFDANNRRVALPVMGVFEFHEGLITRWSDYFDVGQYQSQLTGL